MQLILALFSLCNLQNQKQFLSFTCIITSLFGALIFFEQSAAAKSPEVEAKVLNHILGKWKTPKGDIIGFYKCGNQLCGRIIKTTSGLKTDKFNSNPKLRKRSVNGLTIMKSVKKGGIFKWYGYVYNVKDGQTYKGSLQLTSINTAKLTGCGAMGICESVVWKKIGTNVARK